MEDALEAVEAGLRKVALDEAFNIPRNRVQIDHAMMHLMGAAAKSLGPMGAASSVSKLKAVLTDKEPAVVLASARSLFLLGGREEGYDFDYEVLIGERKAADGFVASQMNELKNPKAVALIGFETGIGFLPFGGEEAEEEILAALAALAVRDGKLDLAFVPALRDRAPPRRAAAALILGRYGDADQRKAVYGSIKMPVFLGQIDFLLSRLFRSRPIERNLAQTLLSEVHQCDIGSYPVNPRREC